jgi:hypothetical protein
MNSKDLMTIFWTGILGGAFLGAVAMGSFLLVANGIVSAYTIIIVGIALVIIGLVWFIIEMLRNG